VKFAFTVWPKSRISEKDISYASSMGFQSVEVSLEYPWPYWEMEEFERLMRLLKDQGFKIGAHLPWRDLSIASPYPDVRAGAIEYLKKLYEIMTKWEFQYAVSHFSTREKVKFNSREYLAEVVADLKGLASLFQSGGINFAVENAPFGPLSIKGNFMELVNEAGTQACLDYGHIAAKLMEDEKLSFLEETIADFTSSLSEKISVIHIHGVSKINGKIMEHMSLEGYEKVYVRGLSMLESLGKDPYVTLEVFFKDEQLRDADIGFIVNELSLLNQAKMLT